MIKAIIFDFDGVIHNTLKLAYKINREINKNISLAEYRDAFDGNIYKHKEFTVKKSKQFFKIQNPKFKKLVIKPAVREELLKLAKNFDLFIITSNMKVAINHYFKNNKIGHIFREVLGWECHKSKVWKFKLLMKKYSLSKNECLFITDTLGDILEANKVGLKTIAVDFGFHERFRLEKGRPLKIISDFSRLPLEIKKLINKKYV